MSGEGDAHDGLRQVPGEVAAQHPLVAQRGIDARCRVTGVFYRAVDRAVDRAHRAGALDGSRLPGRYSAAGQPKLYLSGSPEVRRVLEDAGAQGLIDPSRTRPGLWHLVLFRWNTEGAARVGRLGR